jgi:hypothetical protein
MGASAESCDLAFVVTQYHPSVESTRHASAIAGGEQHTVIVML